MQEYHGFYFDPSLSYGNVLMSALELLLLEPNLLDAQKVQATLSSGGINYQLLRVDTRADFVEALETNSFDLILSDYSLPGFDGRTALEIARQQRPETPFVFVSASVGEEAAIAALEAGASGFVLKHRLERLVPCLERILRENSRYTSKEAALPEEDESNWAAVAGGRAGATLRDAEPACVQWRLTCPRELCLWSIAICAISWQRAKRWKRQAQLLKTWWAEPFGKRSIRLWQTTMNLTSVRH
jgi:CheY-like chemotaxis protein